MSIVFEDRAPGFFMETPVIPCSRDILREYAIYQAIFNLETYCRHRPAGGHIWLQAESEDRATAPVIENALMVLQSAGVEIVRDKPKFPNIRIIYDKTNNPFFGKV